MHLKAVSSFKLLWKENGKKVGVLCLKFSCMYSLPGFFNTLLPKGSFASNIFFTGSHCKVAIVKTKGATVAFFSSHPFPLLALSFSPLLFFCHCAFGTWSTKTSQSAAAYYLLWLFTEHSEMCFQSFKCRWSCESSAEEFYHKRENSTAAHKSN